MPQPAAIDPRGSLCARAHVTRPRPRLACDHENLNRAQCTRVPTVTVQAMDVDDTTLMMAEDLELMGEEIFDQALPLARLWLDDGLLALAEHVQNDPQLLPELGMFVEAARRATRVREGEWPVGWPSGLHAVRNGCSRGCLHLCALDAGARARVDAIARPRAEARARREARAAVLAAVPKRQRGGSSSSEPSVFVRGGAREGSHLANVLAQEGRAAQEAPATTAEEDDVAACGAMHSLGVCVRCSTQFVGHPSNWWTPERRAGFASTATGAAGGAGAVGAPLGMPWAHRTKRQLLPPEEAVNSPCSPGCRCGFEDTAEMVSRLRHDLIHGRRRDALARFLHGHHRCNKRMLMYAEVAEKTLCEVRTDLASARCAYVPPRDHGNLGREPASKTPASTMAKVRCSNLSRAPLRASTRTARAPTRARGAGWRARVPRTPVATRLRIA